MRVYGSLSALVLAATVAAALAGCGNDTPGAGEARRIVELQRRVAGLERETALVRDVKDIKRLQHAYGYYVDEALWDEVADLLTDDVTAEYGLSGVYVGKARVREYLLRLTDGRIGLKHGQLNDHLQLQPVISVADDGMSARGRWRALIMQGQYGEGAQWAEGPYENAYRKEDGVWKISRIHWFETFTAPYVGGWARPQAAGADDSADNPDQAPDLPPSFTYEPWPGVHDAPFHYRHPVTGALIATGGGQ